MRSQNNRMNVVIHNVNQTTSSVIINSSSPTSESQVHPRTAFSSPNPQIQSSQQQRDYGQQTPMQYVEQQSPSSSAYQSYQNQAMDNSQYLADNLQAVEHQSPNSAGSMPLTAAIQWMDEQHRLIRELNDARTQCMNTLHEQQRHSLFLEHTLGEKEGELSRLRRADSSRDAELRSLKNELGKVELEKKKILDEGKCQMVAYIQKNNELASKLRNIENDNEDLKEQNATAMAKINAYAVERLQLTKQNQQLADNTVQLNMQLQEYAKRHQDLEGLLQVKEEELQETVSTSEKLLAEKKQLHHNNGEAHGQLDRLEEENKDLRNLVSCKTEDVSKLQQKYQNVESIYIKTQSRVQNLTQESTELKSAVAELEEKVESLKAENVYTSQVNSTLQEQMRIANGQRTALEKELDDANCKITAHEEELHLMKMTVDEKDRKLTEASEEFQIELKNQHEQVDSLRNEMEHYAMIQNQLEQISNENIDVKKELEIYQQKTQAMEEESEQIRQRLGEREEEIGKISEEFAAKIRNLQEELDSYKSEIQLGAVVRDQIQYLSDENTSLKLILEKAQLAHEASESHIKIVRKRLSDKYEELEKVKVESETETQRLQKELEKHKNDTHVSATARGQINTLSDKITAIRKDLDETKKKAKLSEEDVKKLSVKLEDKEQQLVETTELYDTKIQEYQREMDRLRGENDACNCERLRTQIKVFVEKKEVLKNQLEELQLKIKEKDDEITKIINCFKEKDEQLLKATETNEQTVQELRQKDNELQDEIESNIRLRDEIKILSDRNIELEKESDTDRKKVAAYEREMKETTSKMLETMEELKKLHEDEVPKTAQVPPQELNELKTELEELKEKYEEKEEIISQQKMIADKQDELIAEQKQFLDNTRAELAKQKRIMKKQAEDLEERTDSLTKQQHAIIVLSKRAEQQCNDHNKLIKSMEDKRLELNAQETKIATLNKHICELEKIIEHKTNDLRQERGLIENAEVEQEHMLKELKRYKTEVERLRNENQRLKSALRDRNVDLEKKKQQIFQLHKDRHNETRCLEEENQQLKSSLQTRYSKMDEHSQQMYQIQEEREAETKFLQDEILHLNSTLHERDKELDLYKKRISDLDDEKQSEIIMLQDEIQQLKANLEGYKATSDKYIAEISKLEGEKQKLERDLKIQKENITHIMFTRLQFFRNQNNLSQSKDAKPKPSSLSQSLQQLSHNKPRVETGRPTSVTVKLPQVTLPRPQPATPKPPPQRLPTADAKLPIIEKAEAKNKPLESVIETLKEKSNVSTTPPSPSPSRSPVPGPSSPPKPSPCTGKRKSSEGARSDTTEINHPSEETPAKKSCTESRASSPSPSTTPNSPKPPLRDRFSYVDLTLSEEDTEEEEDVEDKVDNKSNNNTKNVDEQEPMLEPEPHPAPATVKQEKLEVERPEKRVLRSSSHPGGRNTLYYYYN